MPDKNKYVYFGGLHRDVVMSEQSEMEVKEIEAREKEELQQQSLYYRQDYLRMKKANSADYIYIYDPGMGMLKQPKICGEGSDARESYLRIEYFIKASTGVHL